MKKLILLFLSLSMILVIGACGQDDTTETQNETDQETGTGESMESGSTEETPVSSGAVYVISGIIFYDEDSSGTLDSGEYGLEGIAINCGGLSCTTNSSGMYEISTDESTTEISVDDSSLPSGYILTTGNNVQTVAAAEGAGTATDIGYGLADYDNTNFSEVLSASGEYTNYHFTLEMSLSGTNTTSEIWVMDQDIKFAGDGQIIYCASSQGDDGCLC